MSRAGQSRPASLRRPDILLILLALIVAIALRCYKLGSIPPGLNQDEAVNGYDAYSLLLTGRDHLGHPLSLAGLESFGDWVSPLLTFLTIPAIALFGLKVETVRGVAAAVGVLAVPAVAWLAIELFGRRSLGVVAAWLIALSPWQMHQSRWAIPPATVPTMVALTLLALVWALKRRSNRGLIVAGIVAGLAIVGYPTMKLYLPLLLLAALLIHWRALRHFRREALGCAALALLLLAGPSLYLSTRDPGGRARLDQVSIIRANGGKIAIPLLLRQYAQYLSPRFLFVKGDGDTMHTPVGFGVELRAMAPLLLLGLLGLLYGALRPLARGDRGRQLAWLHPPSALLILVALVLYPIPGALTIQAPHTLRATHLIPLLALTGAIGIVAAADLLCALIKRRDRALAHALIALVLFAPSVPELTTRYRQYFTTYANTVLPHFQYGLLEAAGYARAYERDYDEIWFSDTNQPYIYLLFANHWPPSAVHTGLSVRRAPPLTNEVREFGKYHFGRPQNVQPSALRVVETVRASDGGIVFELRAGQTPDRKRLLLIRRP